MDWNENIGGNASVVTIETALDYDHIAEIKHKEQLWNGKSNGSVPVFQEKLRNGKLSNVTNKRIEDAESSLELFCYKNGSAAVPRGNAGAGTGHEVNTSASWNGLNGLVNGPGSERLNPRDELLVESRRYRHSRSLSLSVSLDKGNDFCQLCRLRKKSTDSGKEPGLGGFTKAQWFTILAIGLVEFIGFCSMSIMAPFFPREAAGKGMNVAWAGFVFSFYAFVMFLMSPVCGKILPHTGAKFLFLSGVFIAGWCNILFGALPQIQNDTMFAIFCFIVRGFEALGASAFTTASFVFVTHLFPENIGTVLGIQETFVGLGMSVGPALGGILYAWGGFALPFYLVGGVMVAALPLYMWLLPYVYQEESHSEQSGSFLKLMTVPSVFIIGLVVMVASTVWAFLDPTLEPHLRELNLTSTEMGLIFLLFSALYGLSSPLWGWLADRLDHHWGMMVVGLLFSTVALLLLGPSPIIAYSRNTLFSNLFALCLIGVSVSLTLMPTFKSLLKCALDAGFEDGISTYSIVAGVWSCNYSLGDMIGPSLGGILLDQFDFPICSTVMAALTLFTAFLSFAFFGVKRNTCSRQKICSKHAYEMTDEDPLLSNKSKVYGTLCNDYENIIISYTKNGACEV
nr:PREDICTED: MFS-type transporter SLC18B1-like [Bemisia tabaci]